MSQHECQCNCSAAYESLRRILDDASCSPEARAELRAQVEQCPECFRALGLEEEVRALLRRCCEAQAPVSLYERISVSIRVQRGL
ncbi:hypothetical protein QVA66_06490 [Staphylococcus chromogenes]|nr:hypothetical protein [Staphylococcus chromogenes]